jgi:hypothetical protein
MMAASVPADSSSPAAADSHGENTTLPMRLLQPHMTATSELEEFPKEKNGQPNSEKEMPSVQEGDEEQARTERTLEELTANVQNQEDIERDVAQKVRREPPSSYRLVRRTAPNLPCSDRQISCSRRKLTRMTSVGSGVFIQRKSEFLL